MKTGYSNLLGEYVEAHEINYRDVSDFGIVCPACREPIFKVVRAGQHFLSHRARELVKTQECENRVEGIAQSIKSLTNAESRKQTLAFFFAFMPSMLDELMPTPHGALSAAQVSHVFASDPSARRVRDFLHGFLIGRAESTFEWGRTRSFKLFSDSARDDPENYNWEVGLDMTLQERIARDVFRTICTVPGRKGFHHLLAASWTYQWSVLNRPHVRSDDELAEAVGDGKRHLLSRIAYKCNLWKAFLKSREEQLPGQPKGHTVGNVLITSFQTTWVMLLLRMDYRSYIKAWMDGEFDERLREIGRADLVSRAESLLTTRRVLKS